MNAFTDTLHKAKFVILIYILGILFQVAYVPYQARESLALQAAATDAGYSWVWNRPVYFDYENNVNISIADRQTWMAQNSNIKISNTDAEKIMYSSKGSPLDNYLNEIKLPATWIRIFGIDYKRLLLTLSLWTVVVGGVFFISNRKIE